jgi:hypothetical protein
VLEDRAAANRSLRFPPAEAGRGRISGSKVRPLEPETTDRLSAPQNVFRKNLETEIQTRNLQRDPGVSLEPISQSVVEGCEGIPEDESPPASTPFVARCRQNYGEVRGAVATRQGAFPVTWIAAHLRRRTFRLNLDGERIPIGLRFGQNRPRALPLAPSVRQGCRSPPPALSRGRSPRSRWRGSGAHSARRGRP